MLDLEKKERELQELTEEEAAMSSSSCVDRHNNDHYSQPRGFLTPPPTWRTNRRSPVMPRSEMKPRTTPPPQQQLRGDAFHVIHKIPAGDSPYVRAKHVQVNFVLIFFFLPSEFVIIFVRPFLGFQLSLLFVDFVRLLGMCGLFMGFKIYEFLLNFRLEFPSHFGMPILLLNSRSFVHVKKLQCSN